MWLMTRYGFVSLACARKDNGRSREIDPETMMLRARRQEHLEALRVRFEILQAHPVIETKGTDYRWRLICPKAVASQIVADLVSEMQWSNFKSEAEKTGDDAEYTEALHRVWSVLRELQD
jgi:hypothetical protein